MASEKKINGVDYRFEPIIAWEAFDLLDLLLDVVGPMAPVLSAVMETSEADDKSLGTLAAAFGEALQKRNKGAVRELMEKLIGACTVKGEKCIVGVHPATLSDMIAVATWAAEKQFGDFFDGGALSGVMAKLQKAAKPVSH